MENPGLVRGGAVSRRRRRRWRFADATFDEGGWSLTVAGRVAALETKPLELLHELLLRAGEVVSKDELLEAVWSGLTVVEASLATAVSKLRKALGDADGTIVKTVPRIGYVLAIPVEVESLEAAPLPRFAFTPGEAVPGRPQWRMVQALGDSGAGDVWRAAHAKTGETRIFKFADAPDRLRALKREATLARLLMAALGPDGPFAPLLEWNFVDAPYFLESRDGGESLIDWARRSGGLAAISLERRLTVARSIARALAAVHGVGVLHKDIKPANILIEERGEAFRVRLADFGSGRVVDDKVLAAHAITDLGAGPASDEGGAGSGTSFYRAPELAHGALPTVKSDIYAFGLVLHQLVAGDFGRGLAPGWEVGVADPLLRSDIAAAAAGDVDARLGSAAELAERLERLEDRRREAAARAEADARLAVLARAEAQRSARRPWVRAAAAAAAVGLVGTSLGAAVAVRQRDGARKQAAIAQASYGFLADDLLARADPARASAAEETITEASRRASREIERRFAGAPLVAARLHHSLARAFDQRTDLASARDEYRKADEAYGRAGPAAWRERATAKLHWAQMEALSGDATRLPVARAMLASVEHLPDIARGETAVWLESTQGALDLASEQVRPAQAHFVRAADLAAALPASFDRRQMLNLRQRVAFIYIRLGDGPKAEALLRPLATAFERLEGADHPDTLNIRLNLVQALLVQKRYAETAQAASELLPRLESRFGRDHRRTLQLVAVRQQALGSLERYAEAAADGERVWRTTASHEGPAAFQAVAGRADTATSQCRAGQYAAGMDNAKAALATLHGVPGPETALAMAVRAALADCLIGAGRAAEAGPLLAGIDRVKVSELVGDATWAGNLDLALAQVALAHGDRAEAQRRAEAAAAAFAGQPQDPYQARVLADLEARVRS